MNAELLRQIERTNAECEGWCDLNKAVTLAMLVLAIRAETVLEIGVFGGKSFLPMALALKYQGCGTAIGIDPWNVQASTDGMANPQDLTWWSQLDHDKIYQKFLAAFKSCDVEAHTKILRKRSDDVEPPGAIDVAHIDGSHEETAYRDFVRFGPKVRVGGFLVADDLGWSSGAPKRGAAWLLDNGFRMLYPLGTGAVFQRVNAAK